jgi:localization factor PodJL
MYFEGRGVDPDPAQAAAWWEKSIARGKDPRPAFSLGQLHWLSDGVPRNAELARKYWLQAKKLGSDDAIVALAVLQSQTGGPKDVQALDALAAKGHKASA